MDTLKQRIARRQAWVSENQIHGDLAQTLNQSTVALACECGAPSCDQLVETKTQDYATVRSHPHRFVAAEGCVITEAETVIERKPSCVFVEEPKALSTLSR